MYKKNLSEYYNNYKGLLPITCILIIGTFLRFYKLDFQSLWLDELHTAIESDPKLTWAESLHFILRNEQQSPLFFFLTKLTTTLFGNSEWVLRFLPSFAGVLGIYFVFKLAQEICNNEIANTTALMCAINYFHISYSQEARGYSFVFLFSIISTLYFIKLINQPNRKISLAYGLSSFTLVLFHYLGAFILASHAIIGIIYLIGNKPQRPLLIKQFSISTFIVLTGMLLLIPQLRMMFQIGKTWIPFPNSYFYVDLFESFFGLSGTTSLLAFLGIALFLISSFFFPDRNYFKQTTLNIPFLLCVLIVTPLMFGYIRSITSSPIIVDRYFITILPYLFIAFAIGIHSIGNTLIKNGIIGFTIIASFVLLNFEKKYYTSVNKTQFREATAYIASNNSMQFPIINVLTSWQCQYYTTKFNIRNQLVIETPDLLFDSFARSKNIKGFWLLGAHNSPQKPTEEQVKLLSENYILTEQMNYFDAWVQQYVSKSALPENYIPVTFHPSLTFNLNNNKVIALWGGNMVSDSIRLSKGKYTLKLTSFGSSYKGEYPSIKITLNQKELAVYNAKQEPEQADFTFKTDSSFVQFGFEMLNDKNGDGEDINFFIRKALISKVE